ncbi:MAG: TolC family protein [Clostridium sp.]|nr:TolC family protein [Clostridium sp.]
MRDRKTIKFGYRGAAVLTAAAVAAATPMTAWATLASKPEDNFAVPEPPAPDISKDLSPEFAYSEEKWAALRDNVLEYGEIADLVHEYNPTVRSNRSSYNDQKNKDLTDIWQELMDDAMDLWDKADAEYSDDSMSRMSSAMTEYAGNNLAKMADNNYMDADMYKISYDKTEANLTYQAQQLMATYEVSAYSMGNLNANRALAQANYEAAAANQSVGNATQVDVLTAKKSVQDIDAGILSAQKSADNVHRNLCLMLGWAVDGQPEIRKVPEPDLNRIAAMNPEADREGAIASNYDIRSNEIKLKNVSTNDLRAATQAEIDSGKDNVYSNLKSQYNAVLDARDALEAANIKLQLEAVNMNSASAGAAVGNISNLALIQQQTAFTTAQNDVETAKLQLFLAMEQYDWIKKGLTF